MSAQIYIYIYKRRGVGGTHWYRSQNGAQKDSVGHWQVTQSWCVREDTLSSFSISWGKKSVITPFENKPQVTDERKRKKH